MRAPSCSTARISPRCRRRSAASAWCFRTTRSFPHQRVRERRLPAARSALGEERVAERVTWALELVRLGRFADRYARQLSGGQQQRVALARAIVFHPSVVLMDEPLGALDKNLRYEMQVEIKEIQQRLGMTVVVRHARSGRGDEHVRPHRHHESRPDRPGRTARVKSTSIRPTRSSAAFSAKRT